MNVDFSHYIHDDILIVCVCVSVLVWRVDGRGECRIAAINQSSTMKHNFRDSLPGKHSTCQGKNRRRRRKDEP